MDRNARRWRTLGRLRHSQLEALEARTLLTAVPHLLADINVQESSNPRDFAEFDGRLFFVADHADYGSEVMFSDGTAAGTQLLRDIVPGAAGSSPAGLFVAGDRLYFVVSGAATGNQLWQTDGTEPGTHLVQDFGAGSITTAPGAMADVDGDLYFVVTGGSEPGVWMTDGAAPTTLRVGGFTIESLQSARSLTALEDQLFFIGSDRERGSALWTAGTTASSAVFVVDLPSGSGTPQWDTLEVFGDALYFLSLGGSGDGFWTSDGTAAGTQRLKAFDAVAAGSLHVLGDAVYFLAGDESGIDQLWRSDGTVSGTELVTSAIPVPGSVLQDLMVADDRLYFVQALPGQQQLWTSDGTVGGSQFVTLLPENAVLGSTSTGHLGAIHFFLRESFGPWALWRSGGTAGSTGPVIANVRAGELQIAAGELIASANVNSQGFELWKVGDSLVEPSLVVDLPAVSDDSNPRQFMRAGSKLYFTADDGHGLALWSSDGSPGNATRLWGVFEVESTLPIGEQLWVIAKDNAGVRFLGVTDGTPGGTRTFDLGFAPPGAVLANLTNFDGVPWFTLHHPELGTLLCRVPGDSIEVVADLGTGNYFYGDSSAVVGGKMYFLGPGQQGAEVWLTDGTARGTKPFSAIWNPIELFQAHALTAAGNDLYFLATAPALAMGLWRTDGTGDGTKRVLLPVDFSDLTPLGSSLYFTARNFNGFARNLFRTDRSSNFPTLVASSVASTSDPSSPARAIAELNGSVYYLSDTSPSQAGLWRVDASGATELVASLTGPRREGAEMIVQDGILYFRHRLGYLYRSDGTTAGTYALEIDPANSAAPLYESLAALDGRLYFAQQGPQGVEPSYLPTQATVLDQKLFYSGSSFDANGALLGAEDDAAIATDKTAYVPGAGTATFESISSYLHGITGVMVDLNFLAGDVTAADFRLRMGTGNDAGTWSDAPAPNAMQVRTLGELEGMPVRVSFGWADGAIRNTWLEVTVLANERTGLAEPHTFYFGSRVGDTGSGSVAAAVTSAADEVGARNAASFGVTISNLYDFNRDGMVSASDAMIVRTHAGFLKMLDLTGPVGNAPLFDTQIIASEPVTPTVAKTSHSELVAYAMQHWSEWLGEEDDSLPTFLARSKVSR